ncbi:hypothetical protein CsSME_00045856 [Camellia sinensis var. sinensis]
MASSLSISTFSSSLSPDVKDHGFIGPSFPSLACKSVVIVKGSPLLNVKRCEFELKCLRDKEMDVSASALVDVVAECFDEMEVKEKEPSISTILLNHENKFDPYDALSTPLYQTATFKQPSAIENGPYDYTRSGNPTRDALESLLAKLDKADRAFCFTSGMAALAAVAHLVGTGEEIVAGDDIYGGSDRLLSQVIPKTGIVVKRVNTTDLDEVASAIGSWTKLVWLESPTNPRQQISDIRVRNVDLKLQNHDYVQLSFVWLLPE